MSLGMTIFMLLGAWLAVAAAMLWGVMRIVRHRHHPKTAANHKPQATSKNIHA